MSIYAVNKICHRIFHDDAFRQAVDADPRQALSEYPLTDEERRLLLAGEVGKLYEMGANAFLLGHLTRKDTLGITVDVYSPRMQAARDDRLPPFGPADYYTRR
ncbi:MAG: hypothetical protein AB7O43_16125 [Hyphomicrobiaceae bacterium]